MTRRHLTSGEREMALIVFGDAIDYAPVTVNRRKWFPFQPPKYVMSPDGHIWVHPGAPEKWADDYAKAPAGLQELFIHEMTHVWQAQTKGRWYLPLMRHPFATYSYSLKPGWLLERYGLEQQAEIVRHYWLLTQGMVVGGAPGVEAYRAILPSSWDMS